MAKSTTGLKQALGLEEELKSRSFSSSPSSNLLSLGLGALGLLIRETGLVLITFSRPHSVLPVFIKAESNPRSFRTVPAETSLNLSSLNLVMWRGFSSLSETPERRDL